MAPVPVSGTLPTALDVTVDPALAGDNNRTDLKITVWWSLRQRATYTVPVFVSSDCRHAYLPLIVR